MRKIFILTGANGFLGNNIVRLLMEEEYDEIRALVLPSDDTNSLQGLDCKIYYGNVTNISTLDEIFSIQKDDLVYVIHCAGIVYLKSKYNPMVYNVNVNGTKNVLRMASKINAKFVYVSSVDAIYSKSTKDIIGEAKTFYKEKLKGIYSKTKAEATEFVIENAKKGNIDASIVFPSGIIGPFDYGKSHLTQLIIDVAKGKLTACVRGGHDFVDVRDVARGVINCALYGKNTSCYILSNKNVMIKELVDYITDELGKKRIKTVLPMWFVKMFILLAELHYAIRRKPPLYTVHALSTLSNNRKYDNKKAIDEIGFKTRDIKETVKDTVRWMVENKRI